MLIDGGGTPGTDYSIGKRVVRPFLRQEGLEKVDMIVMTHNHLDHSEGILELLPSLKVGCFIMSPREENNEIEEEILKHCREQDIAVLELVTGQKLLLEEDVCMEVLHPRTGDTAIGNDHSLVLRLVYRDVEWLLTGDIENGAIEDILARGETVRADILKLPHHGSISSYYPEFYQAVNPQIVIVSVGFNLYNQPHPKVREYFAEYSNSYYSTKESGAILTTSDGHEIQVRTVKRD
jgi:competence protein ComEC